MLPEKPYTKEELQIYLDHGRRKCRVTIDALTDESASEPCGFPFSRKMSFLELLLYTMRHIQEHSCQLSLILGQKFDTAPGWVGRAKSNLNGE